jgi:hypothetical protein
VKKQTGLWVVLTAAAVAAACTASSSKSGAGASNPAVPAATPAAAPALSPTPAGSLKRLNPNIVSETETDFIERFSKKQYVKVDDRHIRNPLVPTLTVEFFKEDDEYYYASSPKRVPDEMALRKIEAERNQPVQDPRAATANAGAPEAPPLTAADFTDITPARVHGAFRLEPVADPGLPTSGMWRASFVIADMNGDGIPDIAAPPPRTAGNKPVMFRGGGHGN